MFPSKSYGMASGLAPVEKYDEIGLVRLTPQFLLDNHYLYLVEKPIRKKYDKECLYPKNANLRSKHFAWRRKIYALISTLDIELSILVLR
jgi:hypothetical protein